MHGGLQRVRFLVSVALIWAMATAWPGAGLARAGTPSGRPTQADVPTARGYWLAASDGGVFGYGDAVFKGSMGGRPLNRPVLAAASTPTGNGYWLAASDGGVFAFGDAAFFGSTGRLPLVSPIVAMVSTPSGRGYWLAAADGGVFAFGDAGYYGSLGGRALPAPIVGMAVTPGGVGYWLVGAKGDVYPFGDAGSFGSMGSARLASPIVGMASPPGGKGYWLVAADGGIFNFGDAPYLGSTGGMALNRPIVGMASSPRGAGYWLVASDGGIFAYGDAPFAGSAGGLPLRAPVVYMAAPPVRIRPEVSVFYYPWYANPQDGGGVWRHWEQGGHNPPADVSSDYYPTRGAYSSADTAVLDAQMAEIAGAGVDTVVTSWWGPGSYEDTVLPLVLAAAQAHGLHVAVHIEPYGGRSPGTVERDISRLSFKYGLDDFYVYEAMISPASEWNPVTSRLNNVRILGETGSLSAQLSGRFASFAAASGFDGVYTYDPVRYGRSEFGFACGAARQRRLLCGPSVAPGQVATRTLPGRAIVDRAGGQRYNAQWLEGTDAGADLMTITSYNEWHEGTQIEPAQGYCWPQGGCTPGYDGAYGRGGGLATVAYLDATQAFATRFRATRP
ncbi:MAG: hypothetical protein QOK43_1036 [Acidimicrobiaceae bacterium]|nr:hypothetical protein [Acidimicrobiaceae bacterium]